MSVSIILLKQNPSNSNLCCIYIMCRPQHFLGPLPSQRYVETSSISIMTFTRASLFTYMGVFAYSMTCYFQCLSLSMATYWFSQFELLRQDTTDQVGYKLFFSQFCEFISHSSGGRRAWIGCQQSQGGSSPSLQTSCCVLTCGRCQAILWHLL